MTKFPLASYQIRAPAGPPLRIHREFTENSLSPKTKLVTTAMLPTEILDQITSLSSQHRKLLSVINQLSRPSEITSQSVLDERAARIKIGFAEADKALEVPRQPPL
jgi:hypothetical protein